MDRKQLKQLFSTVNQGDKLKVNYNGGLSEDYTVKERKVWKGKGGSILLECTRDRDGSSERVGTFSADSIVNVSLNGTAEVGFRHNVEEYAFPQVGRVTVRIGFAHIDPFEPAVGIMGRADQALYFAKSNGRNRTCHYEKLVKNGDLKVEHSNDDVEFF